MNNAIKKRSIAFLLSDFIDEGFEKILRIVGRKHDLIGIVIKDEKEDNIPKVGIVKFMDAETGEQRYIDTSDVKFQKWYRMLIEERKKKMKNLFITSRLDSIEIQTGQNYITPLVQFFRMRERRW
jgi:glutaredoxin 2